MAGIAGLALAGCATASPEVNVIGMSRAPAAAAASGHFVVFLEVVNPSGRDLQLSRVEYRLRASEWLETDGRVELTRGVAPNSSAVVEIPVSLAGARGEMPEHVSYSLQGKIFAREDRMERSWKITAEGALEGQAAHLAPVRIRVAETPPARDNVARDALR